MQKLNRENTATTNRLPIKVVQFGEGNFLRAFVEYAFQSLNKGLILMLVSPLYSLSIGEWFPCLRIKTDCIHCSPRE